MQLIKLTLLFASLLLISCGYNENIKVETETPVLSVLTGKEFNPVQKIRLIRDSISNDNKAYIIEEVVFSLNGTTNIGDVKEVKLFKAGDNERFETSTLVGAGQPSSNTVKFTDPFHVEEDTLTLWVSVRLKDNIDLSTRVAVNCTEVTTNKGKLHIPASESVSQRIGVALRKHKQDGVHTSRIPGLATSNDGTLLAIYDARYNSGRDLQGHMDIALNRSFDGCSHRHRDKESPSPTEHLLCLHKEEMSLVWHSQI